MKTPENNKLKVARPSMLEIKKFCSFLEENGIHLCERDKRSREPDYYRTFQTLDSLLYRFYKINAQKVEEEREQILDSMGD